MKSPIKLKLIITKNYDQFLTWCHENNVHPKDKFIRYVYKEDQLFGLHNCEVIYYGEYWKSPMFGSYFLDRVTKD